MPERSSAHDATDPQLLQVRNAERTVVHEPFVGADGTVRADVVIVGSGMGGSTTARGLASRGLDVVVVERGDFLPRERENWSPEEVFGQRRYKNAGQWVGTSGTLFDPGVYYYVGGSTKFYGAMLPRFREEDFVEMRHREGSSPAWPISYADLEPYYAEAEKIYQVHGDRLADPTDPWRHNDYPAPAVPHDPSLHRFVASLKAQGLHPFTMPAGVDWGRGGGCVLCRTCDGYPCMVDAKGDADVFGLRPALRSGSVKLLTRTRVGTLEVTKDGKSVTEAVATRDGKRLRLVADRFVLSAGAVNSAIVLLRSRSDAHPNGLGNGSDQVGRNYMVHNATFMLAMDPRRKNLTSFQKTVSFNDWYLSGESEEFPLGNVQMLGKLQAPMIAPAKPWVPRQLLRYITAHSVDLYIMSEDLPSPSNRVRLLDDDTIKVDWVPNNEATHQRLVKRTRTVVRKAGYPFVFTERLGIEANSHQCGTAVMGVDPKLSVVDASCRVHGVANLWIADAAVFPSSAAMNPALTIAANALRIVDVGGVGTS